MKRFAGLFWLLTLLLILPLLAACETDPTEAPPTVGQSALVTTTLQPPLVTQTPVFTATLTPSDSPEPSITPTASNTPTPVSPSPTATATASPTIGAFIAEGGAENIRVREGPGIVDFDILISLPAGTEVGVLGVTENDAGEIWYQITYADEETGGFALGWVRSDLLAVDESIDFPVIAFGVQTEEPVAVAEDVEDASEESTPGTPSPPPAFETAVPAETYTPIPENEELDYTALSAINVRAEIGDVDACNTSVPRVTTDDTISIFWSWFVTDPELMQDHITTVDYLVTLNGSRLENWTQYRRPMFQDPEEDNNWTVYWYVPIGQLEAGTYTIEYLATWSEAISDGLADFGPGTPNEQETGNCTFVVVAS